MDKNLAAVPFSYGLTFLPWGMNASSVAKLALICGAFS